MESKLIIDTYPTPDLELTCSIITKEHTRELRNIFRTDVMARALLPSAGQSRMDSGLLQLHHASVSLSHKLTYSDVSLFSYH